ncbi:hypothetical protein [Dyadobacter luticola]|uniref:Uncharacterized protein n=1 Tax=Dyadobacter luticola TaxID=1979387 RepID=A0A5R9L429_9BACT|nr:hypothetical protein [Dyadobacter luticola]TLV03109.1 hypothetical protein FEN17_05720 [Dyadobacter luticola]
MKNIECYYKDGSLIFCTTQEYPYNTANKILNVFNLLGLNSTVREKSQDQFNVVGHLQVNYDPFIHQEKKWKDVIFQLKRTKDLLETKMKSF